MSESMCLDERLQPHISLDDRIFNEIKTHRSVTPKTLKN